MNILSTVASEELNTQREQWENFLRAELKLSDVNTKVNRKSIDGGAWPVLSLAAPTTTQLSVKESWKRASQTFGHIGPSFEADLREDLGHGVRNFFFHKKTLTQESWKKISTVLSGFSDIEVFLLGHETFDPGKTVFRVVDESRMITGRFAHDQGGTSVQELAQLTVRLINELEGEGPLVLGVFTDSRFFRNIAKLRAARLLAMKVLEEARVKREIILVALSSYREWTLYERYSNMLRNEAAVASGMIGSADFIQSSGYNILFELSGSPEGDHHERSRRMGRNTSHILALESMLGVVQDAAFGSYHLESLTQFYAEESWKEMQSLLSSGKAEESDYASVREQRLKELRTRKHVLAGTNDFPDAAERLGLKAIPKFAFFRLPEGFEELRLRMENLSSRPEVAIGVFGNYAVLNARLNFVKNYFQLLGLTVREVTDKEEFKASRDIVVLCALDEDYPKLAELQLSARDKFIAGKFEIPGVQNLFAGQDVYSVLEGIVERWSKA